MTDPPYTGPKMEARRSLDGYATGAPHEPELDDVGEGESAVYGSHYPGPQVRSPQIPRR